jgi:hypothetical protein
LRLHLGQKLDQEEIHQELATARQAMLRFYVAEQEGRLIETSDPHIERTDQAHAVYRCLRQKDEVIRLSHSNKDYLGVLSVVADNHDSLVQTVAKIESQLHWQIQSIAFPALEQPA